jgi:hypothetical protein
MIQRQGRRLTLALAAVVAAALVVAAVAIGASSGAPKLAGAGKNARMGKIRLVVKDTSSDARKFGGVFVTINHRRQLNKFHQLKNCSKVTNGCDFVQLRRWAHHRGPLDLHRQVQVQRVLGDNAGPLLLASRPRR